MPELPEVETVVRLLRRPLLGRRVERVHVAWPRTLGGTPPARFARAVVGSRVARLERRGKFLVFDLERGGEPAGHLVGHLRMTGRMLVARADEDAGPWSRVRFDLDDGRVFHFVDVRKFGRLRFVRSVEEGTGPLGPEPLGDGFSLDAFRARLRSRRRLLKPLLLDQAFVAGLGNIYVDESLHAARIHPLRRSDRLPRPSVGRLWEAVRTTLRAAIEREGSSFDAFYRTPEGQPGRYQHQFRVYGRAGQPCRRCGAAIRRIVVGQRGTHVCPRCQRAPRSPAGRGASAATILPPP